MIRQDGVDFNIQLKEVDEALVHNKFRADSHLAFISDNPKEQIDRVERWASEHNVSFTRGGWSDRELYFDLPELFVDFVVEVMHTSILED
ncbi:MAG: hypothetical protein JWN50_773 [Parcubacteria group bacterium]|nr:hypothetical protein [Parcubacteria group bacterium]